MRPQRGFPTEVMGEMPFDFTCTSSFNNSIWVRDTSVLEVTTNKPHGALLIDFLNNTVVMGISVSDQKACTSRPSRKT